MDHEITERIVYLNNRKKEALAIEDFDRCKVLKQIIDKLKIVGN